eukprot:746312-Hanusia_phi.AAC.2
MHDVNQLELLRLLLVCGGLVLLLRLLGDLDLRRCERRRKRRPGGNRNRREKQTVGARRGRGRGRGRGV